MRHHRSLWPEMILGYNTDFGTSGTTREHSLRSPETYLGYGQSSGFASESETHYDRPHLYEGSAPPTLNTWELSGDWTLARHAVLLNEPGGRIAFAFHARDVNLVMGPHTYGAGIRYRVSLDGAAVDGARGSDVDADGRGVVTDQNTYQLIRQSEGHVRDRVFEIEFVDEGVEAYCFTFG